MYICICVYMCIYMYIHMYTQLVYTYTHISIHTDINLISKYKLRKQEFSQVSERGRARY